MTAAPFHAGEQALQQRAGTRERLAEFGSRVVRDTLIEQHRRFFAELPFILVGSVDATGQPWASVLSGPPGFVHAPRGERLRVAAEPLPQDPLADQLRPGAPLGVLGIQPHTRRRNRVNGQVAVRDAASFELQVAQSFGNCPKYIQAREARFVASTGPSQAPLARSPRLDAAALRLVRQADTFFIASAHPAAQAPSSPAEGVDVSHRGGRPGFVHIDDDQLLTVPDYAGNGYFNTFGNLALQPRAGLLFIDFEQGDVLQLAATAEVVWEGPALRAFEGAERLLRLRVTSAQRWPAALPLQWGAAALSPELR
jgi:predicted pyridoxine 5'-phosphate oxidase superfamily flavin-nucleotide-binding protein